MNKKSDSKTSFKYMIKKPYQDLGIEKKPNSLDKHHIQPQTMRNLTSVHFVPLHLRIWSAEFDYTTHHCFHFITSCSGVQEYKYTKLIIKCICFGTIHCINYTSQTKRNPYNIHVDNIRLRIYN